MELFNSDNSSEQVNEMKLNNPYYFIIRLGLFYIDIVFVAFVGLPLQYK